jgi:hypothetical protein
MDFVIFALIFGLFVLGLVLVVQGIIGGDPTFKRQFVPRAHKLLEFQVVETQIKHPPERHRGRLILIGVATMVLAVVLVVILL